MTRGGILAGAVMLMTAGLFAIANGSLANAQAQGKVAPLETKGDASVRPWKRYSGWPARDEAKWSTLAHVSSPAAPKEPRKLSNPISGDAGKGGKLVADRNRGGSCLACHVMGPAGGANLPGNVGPDLSEIGNAGREDEWLFNYIYDARVYNPDTVMPPWGESWCFQRSGNQRHGCVPEDLENGGRSLKRSWTIRKSARRPSKSARTSIRSRIRACGQSIRRRSSGRKGGQPDSPATPVTTIRRRRSRPGRHRCRNGSRA